MNKTELVKAMMERSGLNKKDTELALNAFIETVQDTLAEREKIQIIGFGTFDTRERAAKEVRNPRNPEEKISVPASIAPSFKAGSNLKNAVNGR